MQAPDSTDEPTHPSDEPPIRRVVVATDLTRHSANALRLASRLAATFGAELLLVHVLPDREEPRAQETLGMSPGDLLERRAGEAQARLRHLESRLGRGHAHAAVRCGAAAKEILRLAAEARADLIVLGAHEPSAAGAACADAVADAVRARACCPVLIALPGDRRAAASPDVSGPSGCVLVAMDRARKTDAAVALGRALGRRLDRAVDLRAGDATDIVSQARALGRDDVIVIGPRRRSRLRAALHLSAA